VWNVLQAGQAVCDQYHIKADPGGAAGDVMKPSFSAICSSRVTAPASPGPGAEIATTSNEFTSGFLQTRPPGRMATASYKSIAFGALKDFLVRYGARDGSACAEFSREGHDENTRLRSRMGYHRYCGQPRRPLLYTQWR
jgi:hypothetical protein